MALVNIGLDDFKKLNKKNRARRHWSKIKQKRPENNDILEEKNTTVDYMMLRESFIMIHGFPYQTTLEEIETFVGWFGHIGYFRYFKCLDPPKITVVLAFNNVEPRDFKDHFDQTSFKESLIKVEIVEGEGYEDSDFSANLTMMSSTKSSKLSKEDLDQEMDEYQHRRVMMAKTKKQEDENERKKQDLGKNMFRKLLESRKEQLKVTSGGQ